MQSLEEMIEHSKAPLEVKRALCVKLSQQGLKVTADLPGAGRVAGVRDQVASLISGTGV